MAIAAHWQTMCSQNLPRRRGIEDALRRTMAWQCSGGMVFLRRSTSVLDHVTFKLAGIDMPYVTITGHLGSETLSGTLKGPGAHTEGMRVWLSGQVRGHDSIDGLTLAYTTMNGSVICILA